MRNLKRALSLTLASVMLLGMMAVGSSAAGYPDVTEEENIEAIEVLQSVGVMEGDNNGNFNPDDYVTREQMAVIMSKLLNLDYNYYQGTNPFSDVPAWAAPYVAACAANGITSGIGGGMYGAGQNVNAVQAALMMLKALGYFQYQADFGDSYILATVKQATEVGLFAGIDSNAQSSLSRNEVAQMALNALKADMVTFTGDVGIEIPNVGNVGYKSEYTPRTSTLAKYQAIEERTSDVSGGNNLNRGQYYIQLGEELYDGDLKLNSNAADEFARPSRAWEYKGKAIGTYMKKELIREEYTTAINGKTLYDLLGKSVIESNVVEYFWNGRDDATIDATNMVRSNTVNYDTTGKGVLTQVFFDANKEEITITSIDTFLAKADDDYNEKKEELAVNVFCAKYDKASPAVAFANDDDVTLEEVGGIEKYKENDMLLVQVAWNGRAYDIVRVMDPTDIKDVTLNKYSKNSYVTTEGTQYDYAASGKISGALNELGEYGELQLADYTYNLYFDQYDYLIGNEKVTSSDRYVFITGYDFSGSHTAISYASAAAIFTDGTMDTITVDVSKTQDKIVEYNKKANGGVNENPKWYFDFDEAGTNNRKSEYNMWFTYTTATGKNGQTVYTLSPVKNWVNQEYDDQTYPNGGKINSYTVRVSTTNPAFPTNGSNDTTDANTAAENGSIGNTGGTPGTAGTRHWAVGDEDSIYLTVDTKDVTSGTARGISKVNGVYTGVQDVDIKVENATGNKLLGIDRPDQAWVDDAAPQDAGGYISTDASVFAVADGNNYIVAAVVIGKDTASTKTYGYILGDAKDETYEKEGNYHYWSFEGVLSGKIETLTIRLSDVDAFKALRNNITSWMSKAGTVGGSDNKAIDGFVEFEFDKDGYIIDAKRVADTDNTVAHKNLDEEIKAGGPVYDEHDYDVDPDPKDFETYLMPWGQNSYTLGANRTRNVREYPAGTNVYTANFSTYSNQYTLHAGDNLNEQTGLTLAKDGTVVVIETEVYTGGEDPKVVWTQFSDVKKAVEYLEKSDSNSNRARAFDGWVAGPLNKKGTAEWIILNTNQTKTVVTDGGTVVGPAVGEVIVNLQYVDATTGNLINKGKIIEGLKTGDVVTGDNLIGYICQTADRKVTVPTYDKGTKEITLTLMYEPIAGGAKTSDDNGKADSQTVKNAIGAVVTNAKDTSVATKPGTGITPKDDNVAGEKFVSDAVTTSLKNAIAAQGAGIYHYTQELQNLLGWCQTAGEISPLQIGPNQNVDTAIFLVTTDLASDAAGYTLYLDNVVVPGANALWTSSAGVKVLTWDEIPVGVHTYKLVANTSGDIVQAGTFTMTATNA